MKSQILIILGILAIILVAGCTTLESLTNPCERDYQSCVSKCSDYEITAVHDACVAACQLQKANCEKNK